MRSWLLAVVLLVAAGSTEAQAGPLSAACRAMCRPQIDACVATLGLNAHRCQRLVLRHCYAKGVSVCPSPTTTTFTTTTTTITTTTLNEIFPVPDVRGAWNIVLWVDDFLAIDQCGYLVDPQAPIEGPLLIAGDYDPYATTPYLLGVLGPLTNF